MKLLLISLIATTSCTFLQAQDSIPQAIVAEGKALYRLEIASWNGTDIFMGRLKHMSSQAGGYLSYEHNGSPTCIFFSKGEMPVVLATIQFDSTHQLSSAKVDTVQRAFFDNESTLFAIRKKALDIINTDTLFKSYNNSNLNLVPLVWDGKRKVYVLTGPTVQGVVVFGNDYLLTFDENNNLVDKRQIHKNIIPVNYKQGEQEIFGTMHTHLSETGEYITPTDICTLMLYGKFTKWKQHLVIAEKYVSIWNCEKNELVTLSRDAWERIGNEGKRKKRK